MKVLDTTFLIDFLEKNEGVEKKFLEIQQEALATTQANVFEVLFGIFAGNVKNKEMRLRSAEQLFDRLTVLDFNYNAAHKSAKIAGELQKKGRMIDDIDSITAGIALSNSINTIITKNSKHFGRIPEITVETY
ncbi:type II toxin-antitoxin system VapC family toxin [Candidatus Woesearchaeota archaeon]|nr:type II toxin-antitoxin system VapC family toxin [Candidatus Woesearchaeota archaeon]